MDDGNTDASMNQTNSGTAASIDPSVFAIHKV